MSKISYRIGALWGGKEKVLKILKKEKKKKVIKELEFKIV